MAKKKQDLTAKGFEEALKRQEAAGDKITVIQSQMLEHLKSLEAEAIKQTAMIERQNSIVDNNDKQILKNSELDKKLQIVQTLESIKTEQDEDSIKKILKAGLLDKAGVGLNANILNLGKAINNLKIGGNSVIDNEKTLDKVTGQKEYKSSGQRFKGMTSGIGDFFTARGFLDKTGIVKRGTGSFMSNALDANEAAGKKAQARLDSGEEGTYKKFKADAKREQELVRKLADLNRSIAKSKKEGNLTDEGVENLQASKDRLALAPEFRKVMPVGTVDKDSKATTQDLTETQIETNVATEAYRKEELDLLTKIEENTRTTAKKKESEKEGGGLLSGLGAILAGIFGAVLAAISIALRVLGPAIASLTAFLIKSGIGLVKAATPLVKGAAPAIAGVAALGAVSLVTGALLDADGVGKNPDGSQKVFTEEEKKQDEQNYKEMSGVSKVISRYHRGLNKFNKFLPGIETNIGVEADKRRLKHETEILAKKKAAEEAKKPPTPKVPQPIPVPTTVKIGDETIAKGDTLSDASLAVIGSNVAAGKDYKDTPWVVEQYNKQNTASTAYGSMHVGPPAQSATVSVLPIAAASDMAANSKKLDISKSQPVGTPASAPVVVNNQTNNSSTKNSIVSSPVRNPDISLIRYIQSKFGAVSVP